MANAMLTCDGEDVLCPSEMTISYNDVSDSKAGRDLSGLMHKGKISTKVKIELKWPYPKPEEAAKLLTQFDKEYVTVGYQDPKTNTWKTINCYVGDRKAPVKFWWVNGHRYGQISFNVIER